MNPHKSSGSDWVNPVVLKELADTLAVPLATLFNVSLRYGVLPMAWKTAVVFPMYKSGERRAPGNYRPVSLTSVVGELMEKLVTRRIQEFLERNQLLSNRQHGFRSKRSCATNLVLARERWTAARSAESDNELEVAFIDFSKALDKVPHVQLLMRMDSLGDRSHILRWVTDFLLNRIFCVQI